METGDLIALYRKQCGMTIDDLAEKSGVPKGTLNKIIGGITKAPTLENMKSIAKALGKTLADFDEDTNIEKKSLAEINKPDYAVLFESLSEKDQKEIVAIMEYKAAQNADQPKSYRVAARGGMKTITMTDEEKEAFIEETEKAAKQKLPDDLI